MAFFDHDRATRRLLAHTDRTADQPWQLVYQDDLAYRYERGEVTTDELLAVARDRGRRRSSQVEIMDAFCGCPLPSPPMADLIPRLKANGYRLVLASNTNAAHYERYREEFKDLLSNFDAVAVSHEAGSRKPHPPFFEYAHALAGCEKSECVFVDDLLPNVKAAREFGWSAIHFTRFDDLVPALRAAGVRVE